MTTAVTSHEQGKFRRYIVGPIIGLALAIRSLILPVWWTLPIVVAAVSLFVPLLKEPVWSGNVDPWVAFWILGQVVILGGWLIANMVIVNHKDTSTAALQFDHAVSSAVTGGMLIFFGMLLVGFSFFGWHFSVNWGYLVPLTVGIADLFLTGHIGLNNAAQKPFLDRDRG